jgi:hypothetical protein
MREGGKRGGECRVRRGGCKRGTSRERRGRCCIAKRIP